MKKNGKISELKVWFFCNWQYCFLLLILLFSSWIRFKLIDLPLERDEGEYAFAGQLILKGLLPYANLYNMKLPGIYAAYAGIFAFFGQKYESIRLCLVFMNAVTAFLLFLLSKRLLNSMAAVMTAACFIILSLDLSLQGIFANSEHFVNIFVIGCLLLLLTGLDKNRLSLLFLSGFLCGIGLLMKQHGVVFAVFAVFYIIIDRLRNAPFNIRRLFAENFIFILGAIVPYGLISCFFAMLGIFDKYWFWTVAYALRYTAQIPLALGWEMLKESAVNIIGNAPLIWAIAALGLTAPGWSRSMRKCTPFILGFIFFSFLATTPGFYFRKHYFLLMLPAVSLLFGTAISAATEKLSHYTSRKICLLVPFFFAVLILGATVYQDRIYLFKMTPTQISRMVYGFNPFPESIEIARFIRENSNEEDRIAVIGSEPQIYFYADRPAATGYIYMYPLMEKHEFALTMQKDMIRELENSKPKYMVYVHLHTSWLVNAESHKLLLDWFQQYQNAYYSLKGLVEISKGETQYHWAPRVKWPPDSNAWIAVFERR